MSVETIAVVISAGSLLLGFVTAFAWMIRRTDAQFERQADRIASEIGALRHELGQRIAGVEHELVEVKIAVARIEGPPRRLVTER